ncbi:sulfotransferase family protein [Nitzschia inconspicua]|uniref:Sulfotransferase family protein n=1 Tax=Nitzschia inconspicua TaxID=303405 RepID=A0A9K3Q3W6_9STRA|nr:sulfotransferase family protein [Nitzschia inconspicua]
METKEGERRDDLVVSPACFPSFGGKKNISRIYLSHTRKAGGTTLRFFLQQIAKKMEWEYVVVEGDRSEYPNRNDTLYVVNIRNPVDRIISDYKYEGRWDCQDLVGNASFTPSYENQFTLEVDMDRIYHPPAGYHPCRENRMWRCVEECYTRWYGEELNCISNVTKNYQPALERLLRYDIIVISEKLKDPFYINGLNELFGNLDNRTLSSVLHATCSKEAQEWNRKVPPNISQTALNQLHEWNKYDLDLYTTLTTCGPDGVIFPTVNITQYKII